MKSRFQAETGVGPWWIFSLMLHAAVFAGLIFLLSSETRTTPSADPSPGISASPEKVQQVAEDVRALESQALRARVGELLRLQEEMNGIQKNAFERLEELRKGDRQEAPQRLADAQKRAVQAQTETVRKLANKEIDAARDEQSRVAQAQTDALRELDLMNAPENADALAAQKEAIKSQQDANIAIEAADMALRKVRSNEEHRSEIGKQTARAQEAEQKTQSQRELAAALVASLSAREIPDAEKKVAEDAQTLASAPNESSKKEAESRRRKDEQKAAALRKTLEQRQNVVAQRERELASVQARITQLNTDSAAAQTAAEKLATEVLNPALENTTPAQHAALDSQQRAAAMVASMATQKPAVHTAPVPPAKAVSHPAPSKSEVEAASTIPEIYDTARRIENALTATFQDARAAELAALQRIPLDEARKLTQTTRPVRPDLDQAVLTRPLIDAADLQKQEQQILTARKEIGGMVTLANDIVNQAKPDTTDAKVSVVKIQARGTHAREMEAAALASEGTPARDLSGLMKKGNPTEGDGAATGPLSSGNGNGPAGTRSGPPQLPSGGFKAVPGRRLTSAPAQIEKGRNGSWMFLDSWYLIGPWPNQNRRNLNTKFPPESIINLDATYQNESGKKLGWHFYQSATEEITPPGCGEYEIYYAFTELWSETECDKWIAIGSDDQSQIWVNDELVWKSSDILKGWNPGEGLRKIHLNQGANRILLRLENGWHSCCFSIIVNVGENTGASQQRSR